MKTRAGVYCSDIFMKLFMKLLKNFVAGELRQVVAKLEVVRSC